MLFLPPLQRQGAAIAAGIGAAAHKGIEFESAFAGVEKTVNASSRELEQLREDIREMSKEIPVSAADIAAIAESAGQLGIQTGNIAEFSRTMANLAEATNLTSEEGASQFAQFANITGMAQDKFDELGSTVVALGNSMATTEADIVNMGMRIAAAGTQVGMSQDQIMAYSAALSSVGIEAEAGGTAFSKLLTNLQMAAETGQKLEDYARVAGMTGQEFREAFEEDAAGAVNEFLSGLNNTEQNGKSAIAVLDEMGLKEVRLRDTLLRASGAGELMADAVRTANTAWEENTALANEAAKRNATVESQLAMTGHKVTDLGISIYDDLRPGILTAIEVGNEFIDSLAGQEDALGNMIDDAVDKMPTMIREAKEAGEAVADFAEPFLAVGGWLADNPGLIVGTVTGVGSALAAYKVAGGIASLASSLASLGPAGAVILGLGGVAGVITGIGTAVKRNAAEAKKANLDAHFGDIALSLQDIQEAASHIIQSDSLNKVREAVGAMDELEGLDQNIADTMEEINRANWKVSIGMELTEMEGQAYRESIQSYIADVQEYAAGQHYAVSLAVEALLVTNAEDSSLIDTLNGFYAGKEDELEGLGKRLNETVTEAFNDGFLDIEETETIMKLQRQMGEIQAALAKGEYEAQLNLLGQKYGGSLDADSFINLANEVSDQSAAAMADYESAYIQSMSGVNAAYAEGEMTDQEYRDESETLNTAYLQRKAETQAQAAEFLSRTIQQQYGEVFESLPGKLDQILQDNLNDDRTLNWDPKIIAASLTGGLDRSTIAAVKELWEGYAPVVEEMRNQMEQMEQAGQDIPEALHKALSDASLIGAVAGDMNAIYTSIAEQAETAEERDRVREVVSEFGADVPETMTESMENNSEAVTTGINGLYLYTEKEIERIFGKGFDIDIPIYANPSTYYKNPVQGIKTGHADGGIFDKPHVAWFAEDGPEAAIPLDRSPNAISLWLKTGELLGMDGLTGGKEPLAAGVEMAAHESTKEVSFVYSPQLHFEGTSVTREEVMDVMETDQDRFNHMMNQWVKENLRTDFRK